MTKYLVINADDFGLSKSVNRGVLESFRAGTVTSTTLMVNMPGFEDAVGIAKMTPGLGVGLHFNLTYGGPVSDPLDVPSLVKNNGSYGWERGQDIKGYVAMLDAKDVLTELKAQWDKFHSAGLTPTHLDSHHHIHGHDPIHEVFLKFANEHGMATRKAHGTSTKVIPQSTTTYFQDTEYFEGNGKELLLSSIKNLRDGVTEFCCHPGYVDDDVRRISPWTNVREVELKVFTDPEIALVIESVGVKRIHYGQLHTVIG